MTLVKHTKAESYEVVESEGEKIASLDEARLKETKAAEAEQKPEPSPGDQA